MRRLFVTAPLLALLGCSAPVASDTESSESASASGQGSSSDSTSTQSSSESSSETGVEGEVTMEIRANPDIVNNPFADLTAPGSSERRVFIETPQGEFLEREMITPEGFTAFLWGLRSETEYLAHAEALFDGVWVSSETISFTTPALPEGMPQAEVVLHDESRAHDGIVILPTMAGGEQTYVGFDPQGEIVWYYQTGYAGDNIGGDAKLLDDGRLFLFRPNGVRIIEPWGEQVFDGDREHHHDVTPLPNGNMLMLRRRIETLDVAQFGGPVQVKVDGIVETNPDGSIAHQWWGSEHWDIQDWSPSLGLNSEPYDWTHCNAVEYEAEQGRILVSARHHSAIYAISWPEGELLWRLGPGGDFALDGTANDWFYNQHSPQRQADGTLLLYDNGNERPNGQQYSRAVMLEIDESAMTAQVVWEHVIDPGTPVQGDADRLPNGNVLACAGGVLNSGNPVRIIEATTDAGSDPVWELSLPGSTSVYRATHIEAF